MTMRASPRRAAPRGLARLVGPAAMAVLVLVVGLLQIASGGVMETVSDPAALVGFPPWYGALSTLGLFCWAAAATSAGMGAGDPRVALPLRSWLRRAAVATVVLLLDDAFLLHEQIGALLGAGPGEAVALLLLGAATAALVLPGHRAVAAQVGSGLVLLALVLVGSSVAVDAVEELVQDHTPVPGVLAAWSEEWLKLTGAATWASAMVALARSGIARDSAPQARPAEVERA